MNREEVIRFIGENEIFFLATMEEGDPRVRGMSILLVDDSGPCFCTGKPKDVYQQLKANGNVEMCFYSEKQMVQLRLRGEVEELDDMDLKKKAIEKFPFLKPMAEKQGYEPFAIFRLGQGESITWTVKSETSGEQVAAVPF